MTSANLGEQPIANGVERPEGGFQPAPYASQFVEAGGLRLHYLDYGTAGRPPILCVHGGAAHAHWFDFFAPGFVTDFHVRALDFRGHGDSQWMTPPGYTYERYASDLVEVVDKLDLRDFVLIGDGWNKDGDYNTTFSMTVLPLPAHDRPDYTTPPGHLEDDPVYRRHAQDWQHYHTRYITPQRFHEALRMP